MYHDIDHLILASLSCEASPEEREALRQWLEADPANDRLYQEILNYWFQVEPQPAALSGRIQARLAERLPAEAKATPRSAARSLWAYRWPVAASLLILMGLAGILYYAAVWQGVEARTGYGETLSLVLPDQSEVILNAHSKLWYRKNNSREVWLEGEAFFQVTKQPETREPFIVHTNDLQVEVLGTEFNVNSRDTATRVFLAEGKVRLALNDGPETPVYLDPGDLLSYSRGETAYQKTRPRPELETSWKKGSIIMEMVPLSAVLERIWVAYGIRIEATHPEMLQKEVTIAIPVANLDIALVALENVLDREIEHKIGNKYTIK